MSGLVAGIVVRRGSFTLDLALDVQPGRTLALLGPNGAGKSTAIGALAGVVPIDGGSIRIRDRVLDDETVHVEVEHRRVGVVFQEYLLFPHLTVLENVAFGLRAAGRGRRDARLGATEWLERLGIGDLAQRRPPQLSGGQAQRVALARTLAPAPDVLLLDEPLAALDAEVRGDVREELASHLASFGGVTIVVTHSLDDVVALARDVVVLERGEVTQRGSVRSLVREPATPYVERLVSSWSED
ncbi:MAG: ATP-binding cassette protein [Microbacteriaceae bacterium]|nr:ATP-binding cassette protein [Mycetocola sp.]MCU1542222.1 ATP-binding cassette protein [Microbacteriaceae bacterium]